MHILKILEKARDAAEDPPTLAQTEPLLKKNKAQIERNSTQFSDISPQSPAGSQTKHGCLSVAFRDSVLVSGGQTTVANLFYAMGRKTVGLAGLWDAWRFLV